MSRTGIVLYRPRKGKEDELIRMIRDHFPFLRKEGFITSRKTMAMRTKDGCIMVVFEWVSMDSISEAEKHSGVQEIWMQVSKVSDFEKPSNLKEFQDVFPDFETIELE
jgi:hypothetical protein